MRSRHGSLAALLACTCALACAPSARSLETGTSSVDAPSVRGAWQVVEFAARVPGDTWSVRPSPRAGLFVFSERHYSFFYLRGAQPRPRFADANRPTEAEKALAYDGFIAGAGTYTFDGATLTLKADLLKNPNEMTGEDWRWNAEMRGDSLRLVFVNPPFLPGREWRMVVVRVE